MWFLHMSKRSGVRWNRSVGGNICVFAFIGIFAFLMVLPLVYAITSSLKPLNEMWYFPPRFWVANPTIKNYKDLLYLLNDSWVPFTRYLFNTLFVSLVGTFGHVVLASMCAYPLAKMNLKGGNAIFTLIVTSLMFAPAVSDIINYQTISSLHLLDNYMAIILPALGVQSGTLYHEAVYVSDSRCFNRVGAD